MINFLVLCIALVVCFFAIELVLRIVVHTELSYIQPDVFTLYVSRPNFSFSTRTVSFVNNVSLNNWGFFDKDWTIEKKSKRVLVVGDSFVEGFTVPFDAHFARLLEKGTGFEVLSAGVSSWDTSSEIKFLETRGLTLNPDIVVLQFYPNDVPDNHAKGLFSVKEGVLVDDTPIVIPFSKKTIMWLSSRSVLFKRFYDFLVFNPLGNKITRFFGGSNVQVVDKEEGYNICDELCLKLFDRFYELSEKHNFVPVLLIIPERGKDFSVPKLNFSVVYPVLNSTEYIEGDIHINEAGNRVVADSIIGVFDEKGFLG